MIPYYAAAIGLEIALFAGCYCLHRSRRPAVTRPRAQRSGLLERTTRLQTLQLVAGLGVGALGWLLTGWFTCLFAGPLAFVVLPQLFTTTAAAGQIARLNALEEWVRNLASTAAAGNGLEQAIMATARSIPAPLSTELTALIARLRANAPVSPALRQFAEDVNDASADGVVAALLQAAALRGSGLTKVLEGLSISIAEDVRNRNQIEAERKQTTTSARLCTLIIIGMLVYLFVATDYMSAYRTSGLQPLLIVFLAMFAGLILWMRAIARPRQRTRFIAIHGEQGAIR
ncbi:type II secretion system F family protein [Nocardia sp. NPDC006044]|uniref:type II secretion system F family protein n=1 Tax=Nocardia sp. NPDC006044 TaxID=3364306 RepID=UPI003687C2BE